MALNISSASAYTYIFNFIDEYDAGFIVNSLLKSDLDRFLCHANKACMNVSAKKANILESLIHHFRGKRLNNESFSRSGRAYQQSTLRQLCTNLDISSRIVQKVHNLLQGLLRLILSGYILKGYSGLLLHIYLGITFADPHRASTLGHPFHHKA